MKQARMKTALLAALVMAALCACIALCGCAAKTYEVSFEITGSILENEEVSTTIVVSKEAKEIQGVMVGGVPGKAIFSLENGSYNAVAKLSVVREDKTYAIVSDPVTFEVKDADKTIPIDVTSFVRNAVEQS